MARIRGTLADVSTEYQLVDPDTYEMKVSAVEIEERPADGSNEHEQLTYIITSRIDEPGEHYNKPVRDYLWWFKKDGDPNEYTMATMKRYFIAVAGEDRANEEDLDTDELIGGRFLAEVYIDTYTRKDGSEGSSNKIKNIVPL